MAHDGLGEEEHDGKRRDRNGSKEGRPLSILCVLMGSPYESDVTTTLLRLINESMRQSHRVVVWTCGGATTITHRGIGQSKPRNMLDLGTKRETKEYPSILAVIETLIRTSEGNLNWYVCRHCMEERGVSDQIDGVKVKAPFRFIHYRQQSDVTLFMGPK